MTNVDELRSIQRWKDRMTTILEEDFPPSKRRIRPEFHRLMLEGLSDEADMLRRAAIQLDNEKQAALQENAALREENERLRRENARLRHFHEHNLELLGRVESLTENNRRAWALVEQFHGELQSVVCQIRQVGSGVMIGRG